MNKTIHVLTLRQPWAYLFASGAKRFEARSWYTQFRGELYIHASSKASSYDIELCRLVDHFKKFIPDPCEPNKLLLGAIIGKVEIIDCVPVTSVKPDAQERSFGDFRQGRYAWVTAIGSAKLITPIYTPGKLSIWKHTIEEEQEVIHG